MTEEEDMDTLGSVKVEMLHTVPFQPVKHVSP